MSVTRQGRKSRMKRTQMSLRVHMDRTQTKRYKGNGHKGQGRTRDENTDIQDTEAMILTDKTQMCGTYTEARGTQAQIDFSMDPRHW